MAISTRSSGRRTYRVQFRFWLDVLRDEEHDLAVYAEELKKNRTFIQTIRDGLRLIRDLRQGRVEVLEQLFPFVKQHYAKLPAPEDRLERIEQLLLARSTLVDMTIPTETSRKTLSTPQKLKPEDLEIKQAQNSGDDKPTWNFMISSALSVYGHCRYLPKEIQEYGLRTGRLDSKTASLQPKASEGSAKKMDVPQFAPPSFDEEELDLPLH